MFHSSDHQRRKAAAVFVACLLSGLAGVAEGAESPEARLLGAVEAMCGGEGVHSGGEIGVADGVLAEQGPLVVRGREVGTRRRYALAGGNGEVLLETIAPGGALRRIRAEYRAPVAARARRLEPVLMILADAQCRVQIARRLVYDAEGEAQTLELLGASLDTVEAREPLNPPVPAPEDSEALAEGAPTVRVAMVDAGVNYLLAGVASRLARDANGAIVGYDYWDLDRRPFDGNPSRSPFFPQRHGTQTATLLLREAPGAELVPYRYPRPEMARMADLVSAAADAGIVIVNMSLGGNRAEEWRAFRAAAEQHPEMLFVVSAGNNGRDIDSQPVYPASFDLDNILVATSAEIDGRPARGSNWGRTSVDLLVPAEQMLVTDFYGRPRVVSGSSYAAVRVSALAACLLEANPQARAAELKSAILALAEPPAEGATAYSAHGFLPDPGARARGACPAMPREVVELERRVWSGEDLAELGAAPPAAPTDALRPTLVVLEGSGWDLDAIHRATARAAGILAQCGVVIPEVTVRVVEGPERAKIFRDDWSSDLVSELEPGKPAVFFVRDTLQETPFEAEAVGRSNSRRRPKLADTVWMTAAARDLGVSLAHELYHVLADSGRHESDTGNLMHERTSADNTTLRASQCLRLIRVGEAFGNLTPVR